MIRRIRQWEREREIERKRVSKRERETESDREREKERVREWVREREREGDKERERERKRLGERESVEFYCIWRGSLYIWKGSGSLAPEYNTHTCCFSWKDVVYKIEKKKVRRP